MYTKTLVPSERLHFLTRNVVLGLPAIHSQATHLSFKNYVPVKNTVLESNAGNTRGTAQNLNSSKRVRLSDECPVTFLP